jgi:hypothetical protein
LKKYGKIVRKKSTGEKSTVKKSTGKKVRENSRGKNSTRGKSTGKNYRKNKYEEKRMKKINTGKLGGKNYGKKILEKIREIIVRPDMVSSGHVTLSLPVKKDPLGRILRNFWLRMRRTYFRTGSLPVT